MTTATPETLRAALDAPRGLDPWNDGERATLRALFVREGAFNHGEPRWFWYRNCTSLRSERAGAWDANLMDHLAQCEWELARREAGVTDAEAVSWLGL